MQVEAGGALEEAAGDALVVGVGPNREWLPGTGWVADQLGDWLTEALDDAEFEGKPGSMATVDTRGRLNWKRLILVGLGDEIDAESLRQAAGRAGRAGKSAVTIGTTLHQVDVTDAAQVVAEGFMLGQYKFDKYLSEKKPAKTERLVFLGEGAAGAVEDAKKAEVIAGSVMWARDLVNEPAVSKPPQRIAEMAAEFADELGLDIRVYQPDEFAEQRFGGLAGVAAGSHIDAAMVVLRWEPPDARGFLALAGKGIVFDSGGLSLKPPAGMEAMKTDMSGAAAVLGAMQAIAKLQIPAKVVAATPLTENMPGGAAQRPGDVLTIRNGKTVEVLNTDAEGRLVLADALSLLAEEEPDLLVDVATLTGACLVALGEKIAAMLGNDEAAIAAVKEAAESAGETVWQLPLPDYYRKNIDSDIADMKNSGPRYGGTINGALFLKEFVGDTPWVHLDIAGPARWPEEEHYQSKGGSGFGVRTLVRLAELTAAG